MYILPELYQTLLSQGIIVQYDLFSFMDALVQGGQILLDLESAKSIHRTLVLAHTFMLRLQVINSFVAHLMPLVAFFFPRSLQSIVNLSLLRP